MITVIVVFAIGFMFGGAVGMVISHYVYACPWDTGWAEGWHSARSENLKNWEEGFQAAVEFYHIPQDESWEQE